MQLEYNILWFENELDFVESSRENIEEHLIDIGFNPNITHINSGNFNISLFETNDWDILLMDFDLGRDDDDGIEITNKIRTHEINTEIVLYSGKPDNPILETPLEGVFWSDRDNFEEKVINVINLTIKKVLDINNMRGIAMSESADLEQLYISLLNIYCINLPDEEQIKYKSELLEIATKEKQDCIDKISHIDPSTCKFEECVDSRVLGAARKIHAVNRLIRPHRNVPSIKPLRDIFLNINKDVVDVRNKLAHLVNVNGRLVFGDYIFDDDEAKKLRKNILKHRKNFQTLISEMEKII